jgi:hypothetical protein
MQHLDKLVQVAVKGSVGAVSGDRSNAREDISKKYLRRMNSAGKPKHSHQQDDRKEHLKILPNHRC